jgi:hypothetical protein
MVERNTLKSITFFMDRIQIEIYKSKEILIADVSDLKKDEMITLLKQFRDKIIADSVPRFILAVFNDRSYITPKFMEVVYQYRLDEVRPLLLKQAILGLNQPKMMILKGFNLFLNRDLKPFKTKEEALEYLVREQ